MQRADAGRKQQPRRLIDEVSLPIAALHLAVLSGFAIAQPVFDLVGRNPTFFVAHAASTFDIIVWASILAFGFPAVMALFDWVVFRIAQPVAGAVHLAQVGGLSALFAAVVCRSAFSMSAMLTGVVAVVAIVVSVFLYRRVSVVRSFLTMLFPAIVLFPALFLFVSSSGSLATGGGEQAVSGLEAGEDAAPIVMVVFDELPTSSLMDEALGIDGERFPHFADLAATSTWYRNASTVAQNTSYAVPALLTGRFPDRTRAPQVNDYPENLFTMVASSHELRSVEILTRLCPDGLNTAAGSRAPPLYRISSLLVDSGVIYAHLVAPSEFESRLPPIGATWRDFVHPFGRAVADDAHSHWADSRWVIDRFLAAVTPIDRPTLFFLHLNMPHLPWKYLPSGREYGPLNASLYPHGLRGEHWGDDEWEVTQGYQRHLLQLANADRVLGLLVDRLHETGIFDSSLIVITADHGASFRPGDGRRPVTEHNSADILGVPLLIKYPGQTDGVIDDGFAETIDIVPTVAEVLGAKLPWKVDGQSLVDADRSPRDHRVVYRNEGNKLAGRLDLPMDLPDRTDVVHKMHRIFGSGSGVGAFYRIGPDADLVGRSLASLTIADPPEYHVEIDETWAYDAVDLAGPIIPTHVIGHLERGEDPHEPVHIVVAVNETIQASTRTYSSARSFREFTAMIPESSLLAGSNRIQVLMVDGRGPDRVLRQLPGPGSVTWEMRVGAVGAEIVASDGRRATVGAELVGEVKLNVLGVSGWAFEPEGGRPVDAIAVFLGERFLFEGAARSHVPAIGQRFGDQRLNGCGFQFNVPFGSVDELDPSKLRVFAIAGDQATELTPFGSSRALPGPGMAKTATPAFLSLSEGRRVPIVRDAIAGWLDGVERVGENWIAYGWAADLDQSCPAVKVVALAYGQVASLGVVEEDRGDVAAHYEDAGLQGSGWQLEIPVVACPDLAQCGLRVFAVGADDRASELGLLVDLRSVR